MRMLPSRVRAWPPTLRDAVPLTPTRRNREPQFGRAATGRGVHGEERYAGRSHVVGGRLPSHAACTPGTAEWEYAETKQRCKVLWQSYEDWAAKLYQFVRPAMSRAATVPSPHALHPGHRPGHGRPSLHVGRARGRGGCAGRCAPSFPPAVLALTATADLLSQRFAEWTPRCFAALPKCSTPTAGCARRALHPLSPPVAGSPPPACRPSSFPRARELASSSLTSSRVRCQAKGPHACCLVGGTPHSRRARPRCTARSAQAGVLVYRGGSTTRLAPTVSRVVPPFVSLAPWLQGAPLLWGGNINLVPSMHRLLARHELSLPRSNLSGAAERVGGVHSRARPHAFARRPHLLDPILLVRQPRLD